jgi:hypothetical protein
MNKLFIVTLLSASVAQAGELNIPLDNNPVFMDKVNNRCNAQWAGSGFMMDKPQFMQQCRTREYAGLINNIRLISASGIQQYLLQQGSPVSAGTARVVIKNCTGQTEVHKRSLKIELADALNATTSNAVKVTYGNSLSASVTGHDEVLSATVNKDLSVTVNLSKSQATNGEHKRFETVDINEPVPPYTALIIGYHNARADTELRFSGSYRLQADYYGTVTDNSRSYLLNGTAVYINTHLSSDTELFEEALPQDPVACRNYQISGARVL